MSKLALKLIAENMAKYAQGEDARVLDLGNCGLTKLPNELFECFWLKELILSNAWEEYNFEKNKWDRKKSHNNGVPNDIFFDLVSFSQLNLLEKIVLSGDFHFSREKNFSIYDLYSVATLTNLRQLFCCSTRISNLLPLSNLLSLEQLTFQNTQVSDLKPLSGLVNLKLLSCRNTQVSNLAPLAECKELQLLSCSNTDVSSLSPLAGLVNLKKIYCRHTKITDLSPIANIKNLKKLDCFFTEVLDLSPISSLSNLEELNCAQTKVSNLSPIAFLINLKKFDCYHTHISDISPISSLSKLTKLNCSSTKVLDLSPIAGLANLEKIDCSDTEIRDFSPIANLPNLIQLICISTHIEYLSPISNALNLKILDCSNSRVVDLSPIAGLTKLENVYLRRTGVSDLSPLKTLTNLKKINLYKAPVSDLSPLSELSYVEEVEVSETRIFDLFPLSNHRNLKLLNCSNTPVEDLSPIGNNKNLQIIDCHRSKIIDLSSLLNLENLWLLDCSYNDVKDLSPLSKLGNLRQLICSHTQVSDLRPVIEYIKKGIDISLMGWASEYKFDFGGCPLIHPPYAVVYQGNAAILNYFEELEKQQQFKNTEIKLILVGNSTAGKTSLSRFFRDRSYQSGQHTTHGIRNDRWTADVHEMQVNLWDFGGQEYYHATHRLFFSRNAVYTLVWDAQTDKGGFSETPVYFDNGPEQSVLRLEHFPQAWWLNNIRHYTRESNPPVPILIVQNKCARDGVKRVAEAFEKPPFNLHPEWLDNHIDLEAAASYLVDPQPETRKWWRNFEAFEEKLLDKLHSQLIHYEFAVYHRDIRDKVRQLASEGVNEMAWTDFEVLCRDIEADAKMDLVQIYLRDITGDILYYPSNTRLKERVFLRPTWVCDSIYQILSRKVQTQHGVFGLDWVREALQCSEYQALNFVELMREFELVFDDTDDTGQPTGQLVAPQYLPDECTQPGELEGAKKFANLTNTFTLWFPEFLPKSHIARFVAYWGSKAKQRLFWKNGLLFQTEGCTALVERIEDNKIRVDIQSGSLKRAHAIRRIFQSFLQLEDGQAGIAVSLDDKDFVWWRDVQEAIHIRGRQVKTYSDTEATKYIELQPFYIFHQPTMPQPKKVFISYSHKDEDAMKELDKFIGPLERKGEITIWTDRKILPGQNWKDAILSNLEDADLTLLLVSANFLDSDFINKEEIPRAFQRMNEHGKHVIPIILNYCLWDMTSLSALQATPKDGRPIADFANPAQAWSEVARGVLALLNE